MSTYLVACLVSEFSAIEAKTVVRTDDSGKVSSTKIRILSRADAIDQTKRAVEVLNYFASLLFRVDHN